MVEERSDSASAGGSDVERGAFRFIAREPGRRPACCSGGLGWGSSGAGATVGWPPSPPPPPPPRPHGTPHQSGQQSGHSAPACYGQPTECEPQTNVCEHGRTRTSQLSPCAGHQLIFFQHGDNIVYIIQLHWGVKFYIVTDIENCMKSFFIWGFWNFHNFEGILPWILFQFCASMFKFHIFSLQITNAPNLGGTEFMRILVLNIFKIICVRTKTYLNKAYGQIYREHHFIRGLCKVSADKLCAYCVAQSRLANERKYRSIGQLIH